MILNIRKATHSDVNRMAIALMSMKSSVECITQTEMFEYINRTYYAEDYDGNIVAIICANRQLMPYLNEGKTDMSLMTNRYQIKYALFDDKKIKSLGYTSERVMIRLMRELCADLSDWSVWLDIQFQAEINIGSDKEKTIEVLSKAALENGFKNGDSNRFAYIRVMPINFAGLH